MRLPALDSSDSREMPYLLRKDKRLRYNADGSNNLVEWIPDVIQMAKAAQPAFHRVLVDRAIPPEWEKTPFPAPDPAVYAIMDDYARDCLKDDRQQNWTICKPAFCTWLLANTSDSSEKRVKEQEHVAFDAAKEGDAIVTLFTLTGNASRNNVPNKRLISGTFLCAVLGTLCSRFCVPDTVLDVPYIIWNILPNNIRHIFLISDL